MIRFCAKSGCGRGFVDVARRPKGEEPPMLCPTCRRGMKPLSSERTNGEKPKPKAGPEA